MAGVADVFTTLTGLAPRLRTPIQLAGFLFAVLAAALIRYVNPGNVQAIAVVGAIGIGLVAIPLLFHPDMLRLIRPGQRLALVLGTLVIVLASFGALAMVTVSALRTLPPDGARFDSTLDPANVRVVERRADGSARIEIIWQLVPLSPSARDSATIFIGMVTLHDESQTTPGVGRGTDATCAQVASCVGARVFKEYSTHPLYVRGGSVGSNLTTSVDVKRVPRHLRVWWEFYQREGTADNQCGVDNQRAAPAEGTPPLAMFDPQGRRVADRCYRSFGQRTVELPT